MNPGNRHKVTSTSGILRAPISHAASNTTTARTKSTTEGDESQSVMPGMSAKRSVQLDNFPIQEPCKDNPYEIGGKQQPDGTAYSRTIDNQDKD